MIDHTFRSHATRYLGHDDDDDDEIRLQGICRLQDYFAAYRLIIGAHLLQSQMASKHFDSRYRRHHPQHWLGFRDFVE